MLVASGVDVYQAFLQAFVGLRFEILDDELVLEELVEPELSPLEPPPPPQETMKRRDKISQIFFENIESPFKKLNPGNPSPF